MSSIIHVYIHNMYIDIIKKNYLRHRSNAFELISGLRYVLQVQCHRLLLSPAILNNFLTKQISELIGISVSRIIN